MYNPPKFCEERPELWLDLVRSFPFATLITTAENELHISHVPVIVEVAPTSGSGFRVHGHLARANSHFRALADAHPSVMVFQGPHGYVSPSWYTTRPAVPTWNYAVAHLHGRARTVDAFATHEILRKLVERFESGRREPWSGDLPTEFLQAELQAIVGFELDVERIEAKFKLSQNKSAADRDGALAGLEREGDFRSLELAQFM